MNRRFLMTSLIATGAGLAVMPASRPTEAERSAVPSVAEPKITEINALTRLLAPELEQLSDPWQIALCLRDLVHRNSVQETGIPMATTTELMDAPTVFRRSLLTRERSNVCQGLAILYMMALKAHGIDSRQVQMFASAMAWTTVWSHSSVDVWLNDGWIAMDPLFNISMRNGAGKPQSWPGALALAASGQVVVPFTDDRPVKAQQTWEAVRARYGYRLEDLAQRVVLGPSPRSSVEITPGWDGRIEYVGGQVYDAQAGANHVIFQRLAQH